MKYVLLLAFILVWPSALIAAEGRSRPIDIDQLMQDLRDLDSSLDRKGDHVIGEHMC